IQQRNANTPKVRVYNPNFEEHSWQSTHTVVEVLTDDMPVIVSSFTMALVRLGHTIHFTAHPIIAIKRNKSGELSNIAERDPQGANEALIRFEIDRISDLSKMDEIKNALLETLEDVKQCVSDWPAMKTKLAEVIKASEQVAHLKDNDEHQENLAFLRWVENNHFTFVGFREYDLVKEDEQAHLKFVENSALGTFRKTKKEKYDIILNDHLTKLAYDRDSSLVLTKSTAISTVHRPVHLDYLGIKRFDKKGNVIGEWRFFGLYSSAAYVARLQDVPLLRKKLEILVDRMNVDPNSHKGKTLKHILNSYPRDEMLQAPVDELFHSIEGILAIQERRQLRVFLRKDIYGRFLSALVYVPRDRYNTELRIKMQDILMQACNGTSSEFNVQFSQQVLARVNFTIQIADPENSPQIDMDDIQRRMQEAMLSWDDKLLTALHTSQ
ncbi:MAG: NAD-glutamate dehydrogenase, partial [Pseudomonadota bacterium]|nr:NAD-glutamate dehydrogenase [Pseudomonadota bacterium]